jgi:soluble lytic murein transglycosylase-like protein
MRRGIPALAWMILASIPSLAVAGGDVRTVIGASGRIVIVNENAVQRTRRLSTKLVALPDTNLEPMIARHSDNQNLDPRLVRALIQAESGYNVKAISNKGAIGLMQLMPGTASELNVNPYDPDQNIQGGTMYLRRMIDHFAGKVELAIAAYNAGPGAVEKHRGIPPFAETRDYVKRVLALWRGADFSLPAAATIMMPGNTRKPYLIRGPNNRLVLTTSLSGSK